MGSDTLYGRNWGVIGDFPFLHFEVCLLSRPRLCESARLKRRLGRRQAEHKIQRDISPFPTYSAHWIAIPASPGPWIHGAACCRR